MKETFLENIWCRIGPFLSKEENVLVKKVQLLTATFALIDRNAVVFPFRTFCFRDLP